ncbi:hypothetical protein BH11PSE12_BH11PSE12_30250 [soil metagenome]
MSFFDDICYYFHSVALNLSAGTILPYDAFLVPLKMALLSQTARIQRAKIYQKVAACDLSFLKLLPKNARLFNFYSVGRFIASQNTGSQWQAFAFAYQIVGVLIDVGAASFGD